MPQADSRPVSVVSSSRRRRGRRGQPWAATLFESGIFAGAAIGLLLTVARVAHHPAVTAPCHANPGACLGHATANAAMP